MHDRLVELDLCLGQLRGGARLLRRQHRRNLCRDRLLAGDCCRHCSLAPVDDVLQPLDFARRDRGRVARLEFGPGRELVDGLPVGALRPADLRVRDHQLAFGQLNRRADLGELALGSVQAGFLLGVVQPEDRLTGFYLVADVDEDLLDPARSFGKDRHGPVERDHIAGRRMEIEDHRQQKNGQEQAGGDPVAKLEPDRVERDVGADLFPLAVAAVEEIRKNGEHRAQE